MSRTTHSPAPWTLGNGFKIAKNHAICAGPFIIAVVKGNGYPLGEGWAPSSQANADFIIRAVNAHDDMLAALHAFIDACGGSPPDWLKAEHATAENAIAKAEARHIAGKSTHGNGRRTMATSATAAVR